jgi:hypothetical protein
VIVVTSQPKSHARASSQSPPGELSSRTGSERALASTVSAVMELTWFGETTV